METQLVCAVFSFSLWRRFISILTLSPFDGIKFDHFLCNFSITDSSTGNISSSCHFFHHFWMTSILFKGQRSSNFHVAAAMLKHWVQWLDISSIAALSLAPRGAPLSRLSPQLGKHGSHSPCGAPGYCSFSYHSPRFIRYRRNNTFWAPHAQITACVEVWERSSLEGGSR